MHGLTAARRAGKAVVSGDSAALRRLLLAV
jgi:hypothetical protein